MEKNNSIILYYQYVKLLEDIDSSGISLKTF